MGSTTTGFLSFNKKPPQLHVCGEDADFDPATLRFFRDEGFGVTYHSLDTRGGKSDFIHGIKAIGDSLELGEYYALVAYGAAATVCMQLAQKPMPRLAAMVSYYPDTLPSPNFKYPTQLNMVLHLAGAQQLGGTTCKAFYYRGTESGFAEMDLAEYEPVAAGLAWSRTLGTLRKAFKMDVDLETVWEEHLVNKYQAKDAAKTMATMIPQPYVNHIPTAAGGIGRGDLMRFYRDFFMPSIPPSMNIRLISRTSGVDRVVDEMVISFRHTQKMPWILPGVPPTNRAVQVAMVSVVCLRGGKLVHEKVYWDQASVLVQTGLLDPKMVPQDMKKKGLERLPVVGDSAKKVLDEEALQSNLLLDEW